MTVSTEVNQAAYTGNGVTTVFPYTFRILNASNLVVTKIDLSGNEQLLILGTDYTVSGAGSYSGGAITLPKALPNAYSIIIARELSVVQETDLRNQGTFFAEVHEDAFDYLTMLIQQFRSWIGLSLRRPTIKSNFYDAKQYRIANLADPVNDQDAVNNRSMRDYVEKMIAGVVGGFGWFIQSGVGAIFRTFQSKMRDTISVEDFGAIGDGVLHPLSEYFSTLEDAQAKYPFITSLDQSIDYAAIQSAFNQSGVYITSGGVQKHYQINETVLWKMNNVTFDFKYSEINMVDPSGLKSHFKVGFLSTQLISPRAYRTTLTNSYLSSVAQIKYDNVTNLKVKECSAYGAGKAHSFLDISRCIVGYIESNSTEGLIEQSVICYGTGPGANRSVDIKINTNNRFNGGKHAVVYGDWYEGAFLSDNIFYAQTDHRVMFNASLPSRGLIAGMIQKNVFDTPSTAGNDIYMQNFSNVQIGENWFSGNTLDPLIRLVSGTNSVLITGNQAYPQKTFLQDNGVGTKVFENMVSGGDSQIYFGSNATDTSIKANSMTGAATSCVDTNGHVGTLGVVSNDLQSNGSLGGIASPATPRAGHKYINNIGDIVVGKAKTVNMTGSPYTYTSGPRPEMISIKAGTVSLIVIDNTEMAVSTNQTITVPPATSVRITYTGAAPGMSIIQL